jgi:hypothetical protein
LEFWRETVPPPTFVRSNVPLLVITPVMFSVPSAPIAELLPSVMVPDHVPPPLPSPAGPNCCSGRVTPASEPALLMPVPEMVSDSATLPLAMPSSAPG